VESHAGVGKDRVAEWGKSRTSDHDEEQKNEALGKELLGKDPRRREKRKKGMVAKDTTVEKKR